MTAFLHFLEGEMERPANYSPFHLVSIALVILVTFLLCRFARNVKDKTFRRIVFLFWIVLILFETYKQVIFSFHYNDGNPSWDYQWYAFPFQLCSSPIYILPFIFLSKEGSVIRRATVAFSATYVLFAGVAVMLYPNDVFVRTIGINVQTMVWHGSQVILGIWFLARCGKQMTLRTFFGGIVVFLCMVGVATALNTNRIASVIQMFFFFMLIMPDMPM